jgi:hypothetical protein
VRVEHRSLILAHTDPARLLDALASWTPQAVDKWIDRASSTTN